MPGQIAYGIDDLVPNEHERDDTVSLRLDDSRGSHFHQQFSFGFHRLTDRYNDDEPYSEQPLAALVRECRRARRRPVYFVALVNPYAPPSVIPPGLTLVQTAAYFGRVRFAESHGTQNRRLSGHAVVRRRRAGLRLRLIRIRAAFSPASRHRATNNGFFANLQQNLGRRIFLSGGARVEHSSAFGTIGSGRGGASFLLLGEHGPLSSTLSGLSAGRGVTEPSLLENYAQFPLITSAIPRCAPKHHHAMKPRWFRNGGAGASGRKWRRFAIRFAI